MTDAWWREAPNPKGLSQGDVVGVLPFAVSPAPPIGLRKETARGGRAVWAEVEPPKAQATDLLFKGQLVPGLVVSHSCDLDKNERKARVLVVPTRELAALETVNRQQVLEQRRRALMPLPAIPSLGDRYADLRLMTAVDRGLLPDETRVASMTDHGVRRLQAQLASFFLRVDEDFLVLKP